MKVSEKMKEKKSKKGKNNKKKNADLKHEKSSFYYL